MVHWQKKLENKLWWEISSEDLGEELSEIRKRLERKDVGWGIW